MIDDKHGDKSSNHPAKELEARWFLFLNSSMFLLVWVRQQMTFVCISHQHLLTKLSIKMFRGIVCMRVCVAFGPMRAVCYYSVCERVKGLRM